MSEAILFPKRVSLSVVQRKIREISSNSLRNGGGTVGKRL
jgi:hypothetical protein